MTKRRIAIDKARIAGYENDTRTFTRLLVESRVRRELLNEAWQQGRKHAERLCQACGKTALPYCDLPECALVDANSTTCRAN